MLVGAGVGEDAAVPDAFALAEFVGVADYGGGPVAFVLVVERGEAAGNQRFGDGVEGLVEKV